METHSFTCGNIDNLELNIVIKCILDPCSLCLGFKSQRLETLRENNGVNVPSNIGFRPRINTSQSRTSPIARLNSPF